MKGQKLTGIGLKDYFWHGKRVFMSELFYFVKRWINAEYNKFFHLKESAENVNNAQFWITD